MGEHGQRTHHLHGAHLRSDGVDFALWAPKHQNVLLEIDGHRSFPMVREAEGWFTAHLDFSEAHEGSLYGFRVEGFEGLLPDPASKFQPSSVHGPSMVVAQPKIIDAGFGGNRLQDLVIEEIHVGTFTNGGTLDDAAKDLPRLMELGINAVELMPVCAFDGERGWGYDGVMPFSVHKTYGGPSAFARFVERAHALGISVILDVVYNHFGPSGCYEAIFAPWFAKNVKTPWGQAIDYAHAAVRSFFVQNAIHWIHNFHVDGLRLDAVHAILDVEKNHILSEIAQAVHGLSLRPNQIVPPILIGESHLNDAGFVRPVTQGGKGLHSQWSDDLHHSLHACATGERHGYYADFGDVRHVAQALEDGQAYSGEFSSLWDGPHGTPTDGLSGENFVVFAQNHDQIGNRPFGERLSSLVDDKKLKLLAMATLLSPFVPMLFMGEAWGESAPFLYFTDFPDPVLGRAVERGRQRSFSNFHHLKGIPSPQVLTTFERSKIHPEKRLSGRGKALWNWHAQLISLRRRFSHFTAAKVRRPPLGEIRSERFGNAVAFFRPIDGLQTAMLLNLGDDPALVPLVDADTWEIWADSLSEAESDVPLPMTSTDEANRQVALHPWQAVFLVQKIRN